MLVFDSQIILQGIFSDSKEEYEMLDLEERLPTDEPGTVLVLTDWLAMIGHGLEDVILRLVGNDPTWFYAKSLGFTPSTLIPDSAINASFEYIHTIAGTLSWFITLSLESGAINAVLGHATAYGHRDVLYWAQIFVVNPVGSVSQTMYDFANGFYGILASAVPESAGCTRLGCPDPRMPDARPAYCVLAEQSAEIGGA